MSEKECLCTTPEYTIELNQQGPPGIQGEPGADGFSPSITVAQQDPNTYILTILTNDGQLNTPNLQGRGVPGDGTSGYWLTSKGGYETAWQALPEAEIGVKGIIAIAGEDELIEKSTDTAVTPAQLINRTPQANATTSGMVRPNDPLYIDPNNDGELYISEAGPGQQGTVQYGSQQADITNMRFLGLDDNRPSSGEAKFNGVWLPPALENMLGGVKPDNTTITISDDGTISAITSSYTLPVASSTVLGGIKVGNNLSITSDGVLSATAEQYTLPQATATELGGIKANAKQDTDTQEVRIDSATGLLYTAPGLPDVIDGGNAGSTAAVRYGISQAASFGRNYNNSLSTITDSWEEITQ